MKPICVLFLRDHLARTGGTAYLQQTLVGFDENAVRPSVCVLQARAQVHPDQQTLQAPTTFIDRVPRDPRRLGDMNRVVAKSNADIMHLLGPKSFFWGRLLGRRHNIPAVPHFHTLSPDPWPMIVAQRRLAPSTAAALSPSKAVKEWAISAYALPRDKIEVLYNGQDFARFSQVDPQARPRLRGEWSIADGTAVLTLLGRVKFDQKGQAVLLKQLPAIIRRSTRPVHLVIVGEGPDLDAARELAQKLGVADAVTFTGYREDTPEVLSASDIVVMPSVWDEALPYVALEAGASARPVVAFSRGGIPEATLDGKTGLLAPRDDAAALTDALVRLLNDPDLARRLGEAGREHAAQFTIDAHVRGLESFYRRVITEHAASDPGGR